MLKIKQFKVTPRTSHEQNRVFEHGDIWNQEPNSLKPMPLNVVFCSSEKTGYIRWWARDQLDELISL